MNQLLSSLEVFYHKLQAYHWYVKGSNFFYLTYTVGIVL